MLDYVKKWVEMRKLVELYKLIAMRNKHVDKSQRKECRCKDKVKQERNKRETR